MSLLSCKNSKEKTEFDTSKVKNINEIVETIITQDSLEVLKTGKDSRMLCDELTKLSIYIPEKVNKGLVRIPPSSSFSNVSIEDLLFYRKSGFFSTKDSLYLVEQNSNPQKFKIDQILLDKINQTTKEKEINKKESGKSFNFYEMTIPIFSLDNQKAYLELNHYCGGLCGSGESIYLEKIKGKWKIIDKWTTWIS